MAAGEAKAESKKGGKAIIIVIIAAVLIIAGMAVMMMKNKGGDSKSAKEEVKGVEFPAGEFIVNLADSDQLRYVKADIVLEITEEAKQALASAGGEGESKGEAKAPAPIRDAIIEVLGRQRFNDLLSSEGKTKLKEDMIEAINERLGKGKTLKVYFNEFAVQ